VRPDGIKFPGTSIGEIKPTLSRTVLTSSKITWLLSPLLGVQFELTPKAFANVSPGLERSDNPGIRSQKNLLNPERVRQPPNPFRVCRDF
jgi:hypothetical protein